LENEEGIKYCSNDDGSILDELTKKLNERLQHKTKYTPKVVKTVLEERGPFYEESFDTLEDSQLEMRFAGNNSYYYSRPAEEFAINEKERDELKKRLSDKKDKMIFELHSQGYRSAEIGKKVNLTAVAVRKKLERIKKLNREIKNRNT
jgi:hypothetical protein